MISVCARAHPHTAYVHQMFAFSFFYFSAGEFEMTPHGEIVFYAISIVPGIFVCDGSWTSWFMYRFFPCIALVRCSRMSSFPCARTNNEMAKFAALPISTNWNWNWNGLCVCVRVCFRAMLCDVSRSQSDCDSSFEPKISLNDSKRFLILDWIHEEHEAPRRSLH